MALHVARQQRFHCASCGHAMSAGHAQALSKVPCPACRVPQSVPACLGDLILREKLWPVMAGEVFRGMDEPLRRTVDVMVMKNATGSHAATVDATIRVFRALAQLDHPYLQHVYQLLSFDGHPVIVLEPSTEPLTLLMNRQKIPPDKLMPFALQAAQGLQVAASAGMCHMNLRPGCFQTRANVSVRIIGFSPWNQPFLAPPTRGWASLAPAAYIAPEVRRGQRPNLKSDLYAFGVCLLYFLTGQEPDETWTAGGILRREQADLPKECVATLSTLLAFKPANRPDNWLQVQALLQGMGAEHGVEALEEGMEDARERSAMARSSIFTEDPDGSGGMLTGMVSADVELDMDAMLGQLCDIAGPEHAADLTGDQMSGAKVETPVDILTHEVADAGRDYSDSALLRAAQVGEIR
jgi:hypothetical protein